MRPLLWITLMMIGFLSVGQARAADDVMVVFDGSNSMWGQIEGRPKIEIAREAIANLLGDWTENTQIGLMAYGHRRQGDCNDIETLVPLGKTDRGAFLETARSIVPRGKTPLTSAIEQAANGLSYRDRNATVVVVTDGIESCNRDPCALAEMLEETGVGFTAHVIGFDVGDDDRRSLACIAEKTGGQFFAAEDAEQLNEALSFVSETVSAETEPVEETTSVEFAAEETAVAGEDIEVTWSPVLDERDYVTLVPADAEDDTIGNHVRAGTEQPGRITAPSEPGAYQLRYVRDSDRSVVSAKPIDVTGPAITLTVPETATAGSSFNVAWSERIQHQDYVVIVPAGSDPGTSGNYRRVRDDESGDLVAPADPGLYEVRYVLNEGGKTVASAPIEIVDAAITLAVPETTTTGSSFDVRWGQRIHHQDYVVIVPAGSDPGTSGNYRRVRNAESGDLIAPADPGLYEVRYVLNEGGKTVASAPIEVTSAAISLTVPETVTTGARFEVAWSQSVHSQDYVVIVPAGSAPGTSGNYRRVRGAQSGTLVAPSDPGFYEVRYVLNEGGKTLASEPVEVTDATISLTVPETVTTGARFEVAWSQAIHSQDYVVIVPAGSDPGTSGNYRRVKDAQSGTLVAPSDPGLYEVRYILNEGGKTLASAPVEVTGATISLTVPETVTTGQSFEVTWSQSVHSRDYVVIVPAGSDPGTSGNYRRVKAAESGTLIAPSDPGLYEVRYVLNEGGKTLGSMPVEVVNAAMELTAPETVRAGGEIDVALNGTPPHHRDYVGIAPAGAEKLSDYRRVRGAATISFKAPEEKGLYEIRYVLNEGSKTIATTMIEVVDENAAIDTGGSLDAPETAAPGASVTVGWTSSSQSERQRISLARRDQADFTWITAQKLGSEASLSFAMPQEPGFYEFRLLDLAASSVLSRSIIEVK